MSPEEKLIIKQTIEDLIVETKGKIVEYEKLCVPISPENSLGRITRMDAINNKSVAEAALRTSKRKLGKLQHALACIDLPDFGICQICKGTINPKRVMLMPESNKCVRCASR